jgi:Transposase DDE domain
MSKKRRSRGLFGQPVSDAKGSEIVQIARLAMRLSRRHLADYSHPKSPQIFTQPQLFACLIVKAHLGVTYRKAEELIGLMPAVREAIGLTRVPRFTTLQTFAARPEIIAIVDGVLRQIGRAVNEACPQDAAMDGTGMETTVASAHFVSRSGQKRTRYVKLMIAVLCASAIPCALFVDWGPSNDMRQAWACRAKLMRATKPTWLWGDSAFDSEAWHEANWRDWGVPSYAPVNMRGGATRVRGFYRNAFSEVKVEGYGRRWACETVNSAFKRVSGSALRSRHQHTLFAEAALAVAAYGIKR